jgi:NADH:ubiquinone oxidoreductase subunit F (NADH-binding)
VATLAQPQTAAARVYPGLAPRLLRPELEGRESLAAYRAAGGCGGGAEGDALLAEVEAAGLRGRGGAAFPAARKWRAVAAGPAPRVLLVNAHEGEPTSAKDRQLLRRRPHLVIDGARRAARAVGASELVFWVGDAEAAGSVRAALAELEAGLEVELRIVAAAGGYVAGEESAAVRGVDGERPVPHAKPPRPFESGVGGRPTLVQNPETLANVPFVAANGGDAYREEGTATSPGTFLLTASGACGAPGVAEVPFGVSLAEAFGAVAGGLAAPDGAFLMGGYFGGILGPRARGLALDYDALAAAGSGLGCGAIEALPAAECPVAATARVCGFFAAESSRQCGACMNGTAAMGEALARLRDGQSGEDDVERLGRWAQDLPGRGACALLDGAARLVGSLLREFPEEVAAHRAGECQSTSK